MLKRLVDFLQGQPPKNVVSLRKEEQFFERRSVNGKWVETRVNLEDIDVGVYDRVCPGCGGRTGLVGNNCEQCGRAKDLPIITRKLVPVGQKEKAVIVKEELKETDNNDILGRIWRHIESRREFAGAVDGKIHRLVAAGDVRTEVGAAVKYALGKERVVLGNYSSAEVAVGGEYVFVGEGVNSSYYSNPEKSVLIGKKIEISKNARIGVVYVLPGGSVKIAVSAKGEESVNQLYFVGGSSSDYGSELTLCVKQRIGEISKENFLKKVVIDLETEIFDD